ncbi:MAG: AraC family transcriptional regulator [Cytophagaceae bacterium]
MINISRVFPGFFMKEYKFNIKNMVCPRCIRVVEEELAKAGFQVKQVVLGEVLIESSQKPDSEHLKDILEAAGFELLEDKNAQVVDQIKQLIIQLIHYSKKRPRVNFSEYLSKEVGRDYSSLSHLFSSKENITIEKYIILQKIEKVKELLVYNELSLSEIAYQLDYSSVAHLSSQFKNVTGFTPTEFKKQKTGQRRSLDDL